MDERISSQQAHIEKLLAPFWDGTPHWEPPVVGPESEFRIKVKMAVAGTVTEPTLGILSPEGHGIDLSDCPLYPDTIHTIIQALPAFIKRAQLPPYSVARRRGQLKHVIVVAGDDSRVMVRFVLTSEAALARIREHLPRFIDACTAAGVEVFTTSANINPVHTAIIEGDIEISLTGPGWLPVTQGRVRLRVPPRAFVQTNTAVAGGLYAQVSTWVDDIASASTSPLSIWDLFCGVGGFALHVAGPGRQVTGVELSATAVHAATTTAGEIGVAGGNDLGAQFIHADATTWVREQPRAADVIIVNPPRRGLGGPMSEWLEGSGAGHVIYSSCNPASLAADLAEMPSYGLVSARFVDMFPHTSHAEVVARLARH